MSKIQTINTLSPYNKNDIVLQVVNDYKDEIAYSFGDILELNQEYTFSCWFKADKNIQITINISEQQKKFNITNQWQRFTFTALANTAKSKVVFFSIPPYSILNAYEGQLEIGNKASDFKPSTEDVEHTINTLQTDFKVEQGRIEALIKDTTIDGVKLKDKFVDMQATVDGIKTTIGDTQFAQGETIASKLTKIEATADGLKTEVSKANGRLDNLQVGGRNLICGTKNFTKDCFITNHEAVIVDDNVSYMGLKTVRVDRPWVNIKFNLQEVLKRNNMKIGDVCVVQMMFMANFDDLGKYNFFLARACKGDASPVCYIPAVKNLWHKVSFSFVVDDYSLNDPKSKECSIENNNWDKNIFNTTKKYIFGEGKFMWFSGFKLEKGNKATDWSPAPEDVEEDIGYVKTIAQQTADKFQWIVKSGTSATNFQLTDRTASLVAENINLKGLVTFEGLNKTTQDKISKPNSTIDAWISDAIIGGSTTINGGYIKAQTIKVEQLAVGDIFSTGTAVMNIINAQEINANRITTGEISANRLNLHGLKITHFPTEKETFSVDQQGNVLLRGSVESYNYRNGMTGWAINKNGDAEFNDVTVRGCLITNDGGIASSGGTGRNLLQDKVEQGQNNTVTNGKVVNLGTQNIKTSFKLFTHCDINTEDQYTLSFDATNVPNAFEWEFCVQELNEMFKISINKNGRVFASGRFSAPISKGQPFVLVDKTRPVLSNSITLSNFKLEKGDISTSWSPAPEDNVKQVRFWAGASYEERDNAPFKVYNNGEINARTGTFGGVFTGDIKIGNISIVDPSASSGGDAIVTIKNGQNGLKTVQLRDIGSSDFAQQINITDNSYCTQIALKQDGTGIFNTSVSAGSDIKTIMENGRVTIGTHTLEGFSNDKLVVNTPVFAVGSAATNSKLHVYGNCMIENELTLQNSLFFRNNVKITQVDGGLDINIVK